VTLVIGTDEAGYGPNLGPLVIAATAWRVTAHHDDAEAVVAAAVARATRAVSTVGLTGPLWADSKQLFKADKSRRGLAALERGVLAAVAAARATMPRNWTDLAAWLGIDVDAAPTVPEREMLGATTLPRDADPAACAVAAGRVREALAEGQASLEAITVRILQPRDFNALLDRGLNKSDILSQATLSLAAGALRRLRADQPDEPAVIWCDRHGGRKSYSAVVAHHLDCPLVQPVLESAARSAYELPAARCRIEFSVGGESRPPVALASMTAKYVRELSMDAFNRFWGERLPGLAPTAGYPVDAARWRTAAATAIRAAGIADDDLWRRV
jgi:ribonuclease HII